MKYNVDLMFRDDYDSLVELHFLNVDYKKIQGHLFILKENPHDPRSSINYDDNQTTLCGFEEERIKIFTAALVEEPKNE